MSPNETVRRGWNWLAAAAAPPPEAAPAGAEEGAASENAIDLVTVVSFPDTSVGTPANAATAVRHHRLRKRLFPADAATAATPASQSVPSYGHGLLPPQPPQPSSDGASGAGPAANSRDWSPPPAYATITPIPTAAATAAAAPRPPPPSTSPQPAPTQPSTARTRGDDDPDAGYDVDRDHGRLSLCERMTRVPFSITVFLMANLVLWLLLTAQEVTADVAVFKQHANATCQQAQAVADVVAASVHDTAVAVNHVVATAANDAVVGALTGTLDAVETVVAVVNQLLLAEVDFFACAMDDAQSFFNVLTQQALSEASQATDNVNAYVAQTRTYETTVISDITTLVGQIDAYLDDVAAFESELQAIVLALGGPAIAQPAVPKFVLTLPALPAAPTISFSMAAVNISLETGPLSRQLTNALDAATLGSIRSLQAAAHNVSTQALLDADALPVPLPAHVDVCSQMSFAALDQTAQFVLLVVYICLAAIVCATLVIVAVDAARVFHRERRRKHYVDMGIGMGARVTSEPPPTATRPPEHQQSLPADWPTPLDRDDGDHESHTIGSRDKLARAPEAAHGSTDKPGAHPHATDDSATSAFASAAAAAAAGSAAIGARGKDGRSGSLVIRAAPAAAHPRAVAMDHGAPSSMPSLRVPRRRRPGPFIVHYLWYKPTAVSFVVALLALVLCAVVLVVAQDAQAQLLAQSQATTAAWINSTVARSNQAISNSSAAYLSTLNAALGASAARANDVIVSAAGVIDAALAWQKNLTDLRSSSVASGTLDPVDGTLVDDMLMCFFGSSALDTLVTFNATAHLVSITPIPPSVLQLNSTRLADALNSAFAAAIDAPFARTIAHTQSVFYFYVALLAYTMLMPAIGLVFAALK